MRITFTARHLATGKTITSTVEVPAHCWTGAQAERREVQADQLSRALKVIADAVWTEAGPQRIYGEAFQQEATIDEDGLVLATVKFPAGTALTTTVNALDDFLTEPAVRRGKPIITCYVWVHYQETHEKFGALVRTVKEFSNDASIQRFIDDHDDNSFGVLQHVERFDGPYDRKPQEARR